MAPQGSEQVKKLESLLTKVESRKVSYADWRGLHGASPVSSSAAASSAASPASGAARAPVAAASPGVTTPKAAPVASPAPVPVAAAPAPIAAAPAPIAAAPKVEEAPKPAALDEVFAAPKAQEQAAAKQLSEPEEMPTVIQPMAAIEEKIRESKSELARQEAARTGAPAPEPAVVVKKAPDSTPIVVAPSAPRPERNVLFFIAVFIVVALAGATIAKLAGILK